jgi:ribonuclease H2 subunit A
VDDSKALTESRRDSLLATMSCNGELLAYAWRALSPRLISTAMLARAKCSLNEISHLTAIDLIQAALDAHINVVEVCMPWGDRGLHAPYCQVYVDTVGPPESYQRRLESRFAGIAITVAKKADSLFPIVSAASIVAKVNRDRIVSKWQFTEGTVQVPKGGYGSGYPGGELPNA